MIRRMIIIEVFILTSLSFICQQTKGDASRISLLDISNCTKHVWNDTKLLEKCMTMLIDNEKEFYNSLSEYFMKRSPYEVIKEECRTESRSFHRIVREMKQEMKTEMERMKAMILENKAEMKAMKSMTKDSEEDDGSSCSSSNKKLSTCSTHRNPANPCDGLTCIVNDVAECKQIMKDKACGVAVYTPVTTQSDQFQCKMVLKRDKSLSANSSIHFKPNVEQILYFKSFSGLSGTREAADAFLSGAFSTEIKFPRTNSTSFSTGNYYKSSLWNIRDELGISTVTVAMFGNLGNDGSDSCELTFANAKDANGGWFDKKNLIASFPTNVFQLKSLNPSYFSINGLRDAFYSRQFYIMQHGGCPNDIGPMVIIDKDDPCPWDDSDLPLPRFICAAAWNPDAPQTSNEPNINTRGRFMKELEVTGRLFRPIGILYAGSKDF